MNYYDPIGTCIICGAELDMWNLDHGFCEECQAPVGAVAFEKFSRGEEYARG